MLAEQSELQNYQPTCTGQTLFYKVWFQFRIFQILQIFKLFKKFETSRDTLYSSQVWISEFSLESLKPWGSWELYFDQVKFPRWRNPACYFLFHCFRISICSRWPPVIITGKFCTRVDSNLQGVFLLKTHDSWDCRNGSLN